MDTPYNDWYVEVSIGDPSNRGVFIPLDQLDDIIIENEEVPVLRSVFLYPKESIKELTKAKSVKDYYGIRWIDKIPIDIDIFHNDDEWVRRKTIEICNMLIEKGMSKYDLEIYYSGRGYHIMIDNGFFGFTPSDNLPSNVKETMQHISKEIDPAVYMRTSLLRCNNSINPKTKRYKILISYDELVELEASDIIAISKEERYEKFPEYTGNKELQHIIKEQKVSSNGVKSISEVREPSTVCSCIHKLYAQGASQGSRHQTILRIVSHFRRNGFPSDAAKAAMLHWNHGSFPDNYIIEKVEYSYNSAYKYGCNDPMLKENCSPRCVYFNNKNYVTEVITSEEAQKQLTTHFDTFDMSRCIDLAERLGFENIDCIIEPGQLVTILGDTGTNKTTFAQNLIMGYDFANDKIEKSWQMSTLFLTLELHPKTMHRHALQIVGDWSTKISTSYEANAIYNKHKDKMNHVIYQTVSPTIADIEKKIEEFDFQVVVIDYIELIQLGKFSKDKNQELSEVMHALSNMAVRKDKIIISISQIDKNSKINKHLDISSGKGSGSIADASRVVIGVEKVDETIERLIKVMKQQDGALIQKKLFWTPSWRLKTEERK